MQVKSDSRPSSPKVLTPISTLKAGESKDEALKTQSPVVGSFEAHENKGEINELDLLLMHELGSAATVPEKTNSLFEIFKFPLSYLFGSSNTEAEPTKTKKEETTKPILTSKEVEQKKTLPEDYNLLIAEIKLIDLDKTKLDVYKKTCQTFAGRLVGTRDLGNGPISQAIKNIREKSGTNLSRGIIKILVLLAERMNHLEDEKKTLFSNNNRIDADSLKNYISDSLSIPLEIFAKIPSNYYDTMYANRNTGCIELEKPEPSSFDYIRSPETKYSNIDINGIIKKEIEGEHLFSEAVLAPAV